VKALSGTDNLFLAMEHGNQYMHVGGLGIYDPATASGGKVRFKQVLEFFSHRIHRARVLRRRLVIPPLGIDRPYWLEDGRLDVEYHVRHIALPSPGDWRQLMIQVARIHARPLDRSKPLWEAYIIEGLDNIPGIAPGSFALYLKIHHAALDGEAGAALIQAIHSLSAEDDEDMEPGETVYVDRDPTLVELYSRAVGNRAAQALDAGKLVATLGTRIAAIVTRTIVSGKALELGQQALATLQAATQQAPSQPQKSVATRFDRAISPHRVVDAVGIGLADCKAIRAQTPEATINDIFLTTAAGALRKYLERKGELPKRSLRALMPMSIRGKDKDMNAGNQIGMAPITIRTDIADPLERLQAISAGSSRAKATSAALGKDLPARIVQVVPAFVSEQLVHRSIASLCSVVVSNVRGPDVPLFMAGARLQTFLPINIPFDGVGLSITGFSYNGTLWICMVACRDIVPDPAEFMKCVRESFAELLAAAQPAARRPAGPSARKTSRKTSRKTKR
jgi:WS/DGAT/MGAT family acyltransferase